MHRRERHPRTAILLLVLLCGSLLLFAGGCNTQEGFGSNSLARLKPQLTGFAEGRSDECNATRRAWRRYLRDEKEGANDVVPQFQGFCQQRREEMNETSLTWRRFLSNQ